jgi:hypothetical protein
MFQNQAWPKKLLITLGGSKHLRSFEAASRDLRRVQESIFRSIIKTNAATAFGRQHGFDKIRTIDDYRSAVPIGDFEMHRPFVDRMCNGEPDQLFPGRPLFYNTTSGTTAKPKLIPVSRSYFENGYRGLSRLWLYSCLRDNPTLFNGKSLSAVAPEVEGRVADGTPFGSISGAVYRNIPTILKPTYSTPYGIICIKDYLKKYYGMMRCGLASDITYIICPSPSNLLQFHATVMSSFDDLVRDIHDGGLRADVAAEVPPEERAETMAGLRPDPQRARVLEKLMATYQENLRPRHYWPNLACVNLWKEGNFKRILPKLEGYYPESTAMRSFAYVASEARAGLALGNDWNHSALMAQVYHFEFVEVSAKSGSHAPTLLAHELEQGKRYYILFSNGSGLYRYDINDIIEVVGFYNQIPLFTFIQKGEGITSLTGEKLSEVQVVQAIDEAARALELKVAFFTMFCDEQELHYILYIEFGAGSAKKKAFAKMFDERLHQINQEYAIKRGSKRLAAPQLREIGPNAGQRLKEGLIARGMARDGQYKESFLVTRPVISDILQAMKV